jgi:hypothetical protein
MRSVRTGASHCKSVVVMIEHYNLHVPRPILPQEQRRLLM